MYLIYSFTRQLKGLLNEYMKIDTINFGSLMRKSVGKRHGNRRANLFITWMRESLRLGPLDQVVLMTLQILE